MKNLKKIFLSLLLLNVSLAYGATDDPFFDPYIWTQYYLVGVAVLLILVVIYLFRVIRFISKLLNKTAEIDEFTKAFNEQPFWNRVFNLNPASFEQKLLLEHDFDGIRELNNPTPPWFNFMFYGTIVIAVIYMLIYHVIGSGNIMMDEYKAEIVLAEKEHDAYMSKFANSINENNVTKLMDVKSIAEGKAIYDKYCVACHGKLGEGIVGPNLTDPFWLHGGTVNKIYHTITEGVPQKGMISWKKQLNPIKIQQITSYVMSMQGTNPPNPKAPQGDKI